MTRTTAQKAPTANTADAITIAEIAIRADLRERNDPHAETVCIKDVTEKVTEAMEMLGLWIDFNDAVVETGRRFGMTILSYGEEFHFTYGG